MTVTITQNMQDIAGVPDNGVVWFSQAGDPREAADGSTMITTRRVGFTPVDGVLTATVEPGPALVEIGARRYPIVVPDIDGVLLPLILAGLPEPPPPGSAFVRNFGGVTGIRAVSQSQFAALSPPDPETLYALFPDA